MASARASASEALGEATWYMPMRTPAAAAFARFVANAGSIIDWLSVALMIAKSTWVATVGQSIVSCHFETSIP